MKSVEEPNSESISPETIKELKAKKANKSRLSQTSKTNDFSKGVEVEKAESENNELQCGAHLGGARSVLLMQSSGVGNCVNFFSLVAHGRFPFLTFVSMRGDFGEGNAWQMAMGKAVDQKELELQRLDQNERIETARIAAKIAADNLKAETEEQRIMTEKEADAFREGVGLVKDITLEKARRND